MSTSGQASLLGLVSSFLGDDSDTAPTAPPSSSTPSEANVLNDIDSQTDAQHRDPVVNVVIFSKDRPWQLQELLRTMCLREPCLDVDLTISLELLVHITEQYQSAYEEVIASVESELESVPNVTLTCHREDPGESLSSFQSLMESILQKNEDDPPTHWMFLTDDCVLLDSLIVLLQIATCAFSSNTQVKCFLSRLHPGITWTQTRSLPSPPPRSFLRYLPGRTPLEDGVYVYPLERGELDWAYPWDLSGGIYTHSLVRTVFEKLQGTDGLSHPNRMEIAGNQALEPLIDGNFLVAVPTRPLMLILAINRVQDICQAPLACVDTAASTLTAEALLSFYNGKKRLDVDRYKAQHFNSSHVGDLYLLDDADDKKTGSSEDRVSEPGDKRMPALSVLIPVHTGPPQAAAHAMRSIVMQPIEEFRDNRQRQHLYDGSPSLCLLSPMQIVIVDDRCADGSIDSMLEAVQAVSTEHSFMFVSTTDYRQGGSTGAEASVLNQDSSVGVGIELLIDIVPSPRPGVAVALNHGLSYCRSDLVARMDGDDIAGNGRLLSQVAALRYQPQLDVVGTAVLLFREQTTTADSSDEQQRSNSVRLSSDTLPYSSVSPSECDSTISVVTSLPPTDAGFAAWAMLFSCSIAHPSIVYRKNAIVEAGGYNEAYSCAEDYELWLRMTRENCSSLVSIPKIGMWHRKHRTTSQRTSKQSDEALQASIDSMKHLLRGSDADWRAGTLLSSAASVLRKPDSASTLHQVNEAAELLVAIEAAFLRNHSRALTGREKALIQKDCNERFGELATFAVERSLVGAEDINSSIAWTVWCERCPELTMNRLALLCHKHGGN